VFYFFWQYCLSPVHQSEWCDICRPANCGIVAPYCPWHDLRPIAFLFALEYFLDCFEYQGVGHFYCTVRLRVVYICECDLRSDPLTEILEHYTVEVLCVVDHNVTGNTVATDDILLEELFDCCRAYVYDRLCFNPLREVHDCHNNEGVIALCWY
jgi:hypothetical protein